MIQRRDLLVQHQVKLGASGRQCSVARYRGRCPNPTSSEQEPQPSVGALQLLEDYYGAKSMAGFSIPASEHSTITAWGKEHDVDAYRNMLPACPTGLVARVSDSYNVHNACDKLWGKLLKPDIVHCHGTLVIRPASPNW